MKHNHSEGQALPKTILSGDRDKFNEYCINNNIHETKRPLFAMYFTYFRKNGLEFALDAANTLCKLISEEPLKLTTTSFNGMDGIGDFISHLYFIEKFNRLFSNFTNIEIKHLCFLVRQQFELAQKMIASQLRNPNYASVSYQDSWHKAKDILNNKSNTLVLGEIKQAREVIQESKINRHLAELACNEINSSCLTLNFSLPFSFIRHLLNGFSYYVETDLIQSWLEYGDQVSDYVFPGRALLLEERCMGIKQSELGLRMFDDIMDMVNTSITQRAALLQDIQDKKLLQKLLGSDNPGDSDFVDFLKNNAISFAYFGGWDNAPLCARIFTLLSASIQPKGNVIIIINPRWVSELTKDEYWKETLRKQGITKIEIGDETGNLIKTDLTDTADQGRTLRMLPLAGIEHTDKVKLISLASVHGASGDTSKSELMSSGCSGEFEAALPFIQPIGFKSDFDNDILNTIKALDNNAGKDLDYKPLIAYLDIIINKMETLENDHDAVLQLVDLVVNNKKSILSSWKNFCNYVATEKNIETNFQEQIILMSFMNMIKNREAKRYAELMVQLQQSTLLHHSLVALPCELNDIELFNQIFLEITKSEYHEFAVKHINEALIHRISADISKFLVTQTYSVFESKSRLLALSQGLINLIEYACKRGFYVDSQFIFALFTWHIEKNSDAEKLNSMLAWTKNLGFNPFTIRKGSSTIIDLAIKSNRTGALKIFLSEAGTDIFPIDNNLMIEATCFCRLDTIKILFDYARSHKITLDTVGLALKTVRNNSVLANYFIKKTDNIIDIKSEGFYKLLLIAINRSSPSLIKKIFKNPIISKDIEGSTVISALAVATRSGTLAAVKILCECARKNQIHIDFSKLISRELKEYNKAIFDFLIDESGIKESTQNPDAESSLQILHRLNAAPLAPATPHEAMPIANSLYGPVIAQPAAGKTNGDKTQPEKAFDPAKKMKDL